MGVHLVDIVHVQDCCTSVPKSVVVVVDVVVAAVVIGDVLIVASPVQAVEASEAALELEKMHHEV